MTMVKVVRPVVWVSLEEKKNAEQNFQVTFFFSASLILNFDKTNDILFQKQKKYDEPLVG